MRADGAVWKITSLGLEKKCPHCKEFWPADPEFYHRRRNSEPFEPQSYCKACVTERCNELRNRIPVYRRHEGI